MYVFLIAVKSLFVSVFMLSKALSVVCGSFFMSFFPSLDHSMFFSAMTQGDLVLLG